MIKLKSNGHKPAGYWTFIRCKKDALRFNRPRDWQVNSKGSWCAAYKNGWLEVCYSHMQVRNPKNFWTKQNCLKVAKSCNSLKELSERYESAYKVILENKWSLEFFQHFELGRKPKGYWENKENCLKAARSCKMKSEFMARFKLAYQNSRDSGWLKEMYAHMEIIGNIKKRALYVFEFEDGSAYVGLTYNYKERLEGHMSKSKWYKEKMESNISYKFIRLNIFYDIAVAALKEIELIDYYRNNGWNILNKHRGGGLGKPQKKWTLEICKLDALRFAYRSEWKEKSPLIYKAAVRSGWLGECCKHMPKRKPTLDKKILCIETGIVYPSIQEASRKLKIGNGHLSYVVNGKLKKAKGYTFKFV